MHRAGVICLLIGLVLGLPLLGLLWSDQPLARYLEFPPRTGYVQHEPFSWPVFLVLATLIVGMVSPFVLRISSFVSRSSSEISRFTSHASRSTRFPWWGRLGLGWTGLWWLLAWTRFPWMAAVQEHTFTPLWLGYIVSVNAWTLARTGRCMMVHRSRYFLSLFPLSAAFWWAFEYLNRFVQNWHYVGVTELSPLEYVLRATLPFSTVLPAVLGTAELVASYSTVTAGLDRLKPIPVRFVRPISWALLILSCLGLLGIGLWPNYLFPLVWVGPLLLMISLQTLAGRPTVLSPFSRRDWRVVWGSALAALICGIFWELWNWKSLAHWQYAIPFVHRFQLFEMPALGYAGYLPFGLECLAVAELCLRRHFAGGVEEDRHQ
jgi:hypothetical protein